MNEKADRAAIAAALNWLLDRPKTMLLIIGLMGGTGIVREGSRFMAGETVHATVAIDEAKVRTIVKEEQALALVPVNNALADTNTRLGRIENALMLRGLSANVGPSMAVIKGD